MKAKTKTMKTTTKKTALKTTRPFRKQIKGHVITWSKKEERYIIKSLKGKRVYDSHTVKDAELWINRNCKKSLGEIDSESLLGAKKKRISKIAAKARAIKKLVLAAKERQSEQKRKQPVIAKKTRVSKVKQTKAGKKSNKSRKALSPGVRISKTGRVYTETRSNRAD